MLLEVVPIGSSDAQSAEHVDFLHVDVMDGHFVPNLTFGMPVIRALRATTDLDFDCHLMVTFPTHYIDTLAKAGANCFTFDY